MKIAIITFHRAVNYGGVLQAYALQRFLNDISITSEVIDYRNTLFKKQYSSIQNTGSLAKNIARLICVTPFQWKKNRRFESFLRKNLILSKPYKRRDLMKLCDNFDYILTGSDQVFNSKLTGEDDTYFLDFVKDDRKKISYAASFGGIVEDKENSDRNLMLLSHFFHISVREETGVQYLENNKIHAQKHIDPTLLLQPDSWNGITHSVKYNHYILLYTLGRGPYVDETVHGAIELAEKTGMEILYISDRLHSSGKGFKHIRHIRYSSPETFVSLFQNSDVVVTNSFHGTAFSIIFHKEFYSNWKMPNSKGNRIINLLALTGINQPEFHEALLYRSAAKICWKSVEEKLSIERARSKQYFELL